jgi:hypothetical protein
MTEDGYELFCNRDERRSRLPALPPRADERHGVKFIAPIDADAGGSWLAVNQRGTSLCLLNHSVDTPPPPRPVSRGLLVWSLIDRKDPEPTGVERYRPFLLLVFALRQEPRLWRWDGQKLEYERPEMPVTTSSFDTANVIRARRERLAALTSTPCKVWKRLEQYHLTGNDADSVCMSRPDAQTVSFSHVIVRPGKIEFRYRPRLPDGSFAPATVVTLP